MSSRRCWPSPSRAFTPSSTVFFVGQSLGDIGLAAITLGSGLCFRRLEPPLECSHALIWKRHAVLSKPAEAFLEKVKQA